MKQNSLSLRLLMASSISVLTALLATGLAFGYFFKTYFEDRVRSELATQLQQLTANIEFDEAGKFLIYPLSDQRFEQPFSGLYWQIDPEGTKPIISRSLWDFTMELKRPDDMGDQHTQRLQANGFDLMVLSWVVSVGENENQQNLLLSVATDYRQIQETADKFNKNLILWLSLLAAALIFAAWLQVRVGLRPLEAIRVQISKIRDGSADRMTGKFPAEVEPLVSEVNELLENQQENLTFARKHASDLAHGLKTPLTVMRALAQQIRDGEIEGLAGEIDLQTDAMAHFVDRELALSRIVFDPTTRTPLLPAVTRMVNAISRLPSDRPIDWQINIPEEIDAYFDEHNLSEMLGNLLDNAREWTHNLVNITATKQNGQVELTITDNGPGLEGSQLVEVLERGKRLDTTRQGTGLGLAIVQDLAKSLGCKLTLINAKKGGLIVSLSWVARK